MFDESELYRNCPREPESLEETEARYNLIKLLKEDGYSDMDLVDLYDQHGCYDPTGYGICIECGKIIYGTKAWFKECF